MCGKRTCHTMCTRSGPCSAPRCSCAPMLQQAAHRLRCTFTCSGVPAARAGHGTGTGPQTPGHESSMFLRNSGGRLQQDGRRNWYSSACCSCKPNTFILRLVVLICVRDSDKDGWEMCTEDLDWWDAMLPSLPRASTQRWW